MQLTIKERLLLLNVLPHEGDVTTVRIVRKLREALSFSEEEHKRLGLAEKDGVVEWIPEFSAETFDIEIGPKAATVAQEALKKLDSSQKLTEDYLSLWDLFCEA